MDDQTSRTTAPTSIVVVGITKPSVLATVVVPVEVAAPVIDPPNTIQVWVCPVCAGWAGSSKLGDLSVAPNHRTSLKNRADEDPSEWGKITNYRDTCQHCRAQGIESVRVLVEYVRQEVIEASIGRALEQAHQQYAKDAAGR